MPQRAQTGGSLPNVTTRTASASQTINIQDTDQAEYPEQLTDIDNDDDRETTNVAQLQEQIRAMAQERQSDREHIAQLLTQMAAFTAAIRTPPGRSVEPDTLSATTTTSGRLEAQRYSKKRPDPPIFTDGIDPVFESWKIQIQAKLRANADYYPMEEDKMEYVFSRTLGAAQKHLLPKFDEDSPIRFTTVREMLQHLASIYVNPNKVRDAQYEFRRLRMQATQAFSEFQTTFLHLAGEGQVPRSSYRLDLFDKLPSYLQKMLLPTLDDLETYEQLAARCLTLDTGLKRIEEAEKQKRSQDRKRTAQAALAPVTLGVKETATTLPTSPLYGQTSESPSRQGSRQSTPADTSTVKCYNCHKPGHFAFRCPEPKKADLQAIEEDLSDTESGKEEP
jgi:hypothetical protein